LFWVLSDDNSNARSSVPRSVRPTAVWDITTLLSSAQRGISRSTGIEFGIDFPRVRFVVNDAAFDFDPRMGSERALLDPGDIRAGTP
jgi:hypothetical protein